MQNATRPRPAAVLPVLRVHAKHDSLRHTDVRSRLLALRSKLSPPGTSSASGSTRDKMEQILDERPLHRVTLPPRETVLQPIRSGAESLQTKDFARNVGEPCPQAPTFPCPTLGAQRQAQYTSNFVPRTARA